MSKPKGKVLKSFRFPPELADWAAQYAKDNNTSVTQLLIDYLTNLRKHVESGYADQV